MEAQQSVECLIPRTCADDCPVVQSNCELEGIELGFDQQRI